VWLYYGVFNYNKAYLAVFSVNNGHFSAFKVGLWAFMVFIRINSAFNA